MSTPIRILLFVMLLLCGRWSFAQEVLTGTVDYPQLGITFTVPDGWEAQEGDGLVFLGSEKIPGLIVMTIHESTGMAMMMEALADGFSEDGIELFANGTAREIRSDAAMIDYIGQIEDQPAKGRGYALLNPFGNGVAIIVLGLENTWSDRLTRTAEELMRSVEFKKAVYTGPSVEHWKRHLNNTRLTRIENYDSPAAVEGGAGGGYSSKTEIDLCNSWFSMRSAANVDVSTDVSSANSSGNSNSTGTWEVIEGRNGKPMLRLLHHDGRQSDHVLDEQEGKVYLDGQRWFRTWEGEYAPKCK